MCKLDKLGNEFRSNDKRDQEQNTGTVVISDFFLL